jgi:hypothetical protein
MKRRLGIAFAVMAFVAAVPMGVLAGPAKVAVCHYDNDGVASAPKTLWVGNQKAANKHVANHTTANGHEGNDTLGACVV